MQSHVFTCASFANQLIDTIRRHPTATGLRLQLLPPSTSLVCAAAAATAPAQATDSDSADWITLYAVLLAPNADAGGGGDGALVAAYAVVGHVSCVSLHWCAQLQRSLSLATLLTSTTHSFERRGQRFRCLEPRQTCGLGTGVTWFAAQLAPYVPALQWSRDVDGVLGSHHSVSVSFACAAPAAAAAATSAAETGCDDGCDARVTNLGDADTESGESSDSEAAAAALSLTTDAPAATEYCDHRPLRRVRHEGCGATPAASACLPLRVAAVLNGNVPLPSPRNQADARAETCVLCLSAIDGVLLTGASPNDVNVQRLEHHPSPEAFDAACEFLGHDVVPCVSLRCIDGEWSREGASSSRLRSDVCHVRRRLGTSYAIQYSAHTPATARARSIVFVVDMSVLLASHVIASPRPGSLNARRAIAVQVADAMTVALSELVAQNPDVFAFAGGGVGTAAAAAADVPAAGRSTASMTPVMLCRSIAESVRVLVDLSPHPDFAAEVERLLWASGEGADGSVAARPQRAARRTAAELQERIEERLRRLLPS